MLQVVRPTFPFSRFIFALAADLYDEAWSFFEIIVGKNYYKD